MRPQTGDWTASVGGSHARHGDIGVPGIWGNDDFLTLEIHDFAVYSNASSGCAPADVYHFNAADDEGVWRQQWNGDLTALLDDRVRGQIPKLPAPSPGGVAALIAPLSNGIANDVSARRHPRTGALQLPPMRPSAPSRGGRHTMWQTRSQSGNRVEFRRSQPLGWEHNVNGAAPPAAARPRHHDTRRFVMLSQSIPPTGHAALTPEQQDALTKVVMREVPGYASAEALLVLGPGRVD